MPLGAVISEGSSGENVIHFAVIRVRMTGTGNLQIRVFSYDDVRIKILVAIPVNPAPGRIMSRLVNFTDQRASFELKTTQINETFRINRITVYAKEVFTGYPQ
jgi:hypothetical protein